MTSRTTTDSPLLHPREIFVNGRWVAPLQNNVIEVVDSNDEQVYLSVAAAGKEDVGRAVSAARAAFDEGVWPRMTHAQRADYVRLLADALRSRSAILADVWPRESGVLYSFSAGTGDFYADVLNFYADLAADFAWEEPAPTTPGAGFS
ncbi:MAG: Aldehyde Dehydrogenase, partial [Mycobacterium sp.]|nr:Aldehyde Dehydrogenase [Mycobacterium sp.]